MEFRVDRQGRPLDLAGAESTVDGSFTVFKVDFDLDEDAVDVQ